LKKILLLILFFLATGFCFPSPVFGAQMEMTVTITSVKVPARAEMLLADDGPTAEFSLGVGRIVVVRDGDDYIEVRRTFPGWYFQAGEVVTLIFNYNAAEAPYKVYGEVSVAAAPLPEEGARICRADCSVVGDATGWYIFELYISDYDYAYCPPSVCHDPVGSYNYFLAVEPGHVITDIEDSQPYWRSPALYTIN